MVTSNYQATTVSRRLARERRLWDDAAKFHMSLGCGSCPELEICGGLHLSAQVFSCLDFCCGQPEDCNAVCLNSPENFVNRIREVQDFDLDSLPLLQPLPNVSLPLVVPVIYGSAGRSGLLTTPMVSVPLYRLIDRKRGVARFDSAEMLADAFKISPATQLVLTGTAFDSALERWWDLGERRAELIQAFRKAGAVLATTPNFSLFTDLPRWDNLHNIKRIAICYYEFLANGLLAALHLNARTERDWGRWSEFVKARPEVTHVAFEFSTGAGWPARKKWHMQQLLGFARRVERPISLVVRGGTEFLGVLSSSFSQVTVLETSVYLKTMKRRQAVLTSNGLLRWAPAYTKSGAPLDDLLASNIGMTLECFQKSSQLRVASRF
jgi:hypothetical protein